MGIVRLRIGLRKGWKQHAKRGMVCALFRDLALYRPKYLNVAEFFISK